MSEYPSVHVNHDREVAYNQGPEPQPGDLVRYVLHETDPAAIRQAIPQSNSHQSGEILGAMVVRCWGPGMVNLMVFIDGARPWWCTSVGYDMPTQVEGVDAAVAAYEVAPRSWHYPIDLFMDKIREAVDAMEIPASETPGICGLCGEPMPAGEEMFRYHGHSGPCPEYASGGLVDPSQAAVVSEHGVSAPRKVTDSPQA